MGLMKKNFVKGKWTILDPKMMLPKMLILLNQRAKRCKKIISIVL